MIKKYLYLFIISLVLIVGIIFVLFYKYHWLDNKYYISDNIIIYLPKAWQQLNEKELKTQNSQGKIGFKKNKSNNTNFVIRVDEMIGKKNFDAKGSIEGIESALNKTVGNVTIDYIKPITFKNIPAVETRFNYTVPTDMMGGKLSMTQHQIIFLYQEKLYWLMFGSSPEEFDRDNKEFDQILKNLKID